MVEKLIERTTHMLRNWRPSQIHRREKVWNSGTSRKFVICCKGQWNFHQIFQGDKIQNGHQIPCQNCAFLVAFGPKLPKFQYNSCQWKHQDQIQKDFLKQKFTEASDKPIMVRFEVNNQNLIEFLVHKSTNFDRRYLEREQQESATNWLPNPFALSEYFLVGILQDEKKLPG